MEGAADGKELGILTPIGVDPGDGRSLLLFVKRAFNPYTLRGR